MHRLMKSSMKTSSMYLGSFLFFISSGKFLYSSDVFVYLRNLFAGISPTFVFAYCPATSLAVSNAAPKYAGDSIHLVCKDVGITILIGLSSTLGKMYVKFHYESYSVTILHNPPFISSFAINTISSYLLSVIVSMILGSTCLNCSIALGGVVFLVAAFTALKMYCSSIISTGKLRSNRAHHFLNLCGIIANCQLPTVRFLAFLVCFSLICPM